MERTHANRPQQSDERRQPNVSGISRLRTFGVLLKTSRFISPLIPARGLERSVKMYTVNESYKNIEAEFKPRSKWGH